MIVFNLFFFFPLPFQSAKYCITSFPQTKVAENQQTFACIHLSTLISTQLEPPLLPLSLNRHLFSTWFYTVVRKGTIAHSFPL